MAHPTTSHTHRLHANEIAAISAQTGALLFMLGRLLETHPDFQEQISMHTSDLLVTIGMKLAKNHFHAKTN